MYIVLASSRLYSYWRQAITGDDDDDDTNYLICIFMNINEHLKNEVKSKKT